jgi:hypothetical protein
MGDGVLNHNSERILHMYQIKLQYTLKDFSGFCLIELFADFTPYVLFIDMAAMMVSRQCHRT